MTKLTLERASASFTEKFKQSGQLCQTASEFIPGGYSRNSLTFGPHAIFVSGGSGQYFETIEGHRLLDFHNNFSCSITGHNHPRIFAALSAQLPKGFSYGNPMPHEYQLAKILCERIEAVEKVIFSCSASESCLSAIRIARANTGKDKIAKFEGGYHGIGDEFMMSLHPFEAPAMIFPGPRTNPIPVANTAGIPKHTRENVLVLPQNDLENCERILRAHASETAGLIMELQTGAGGVVVLEREFVQGIRALTEELGILLIVDETVTLRADYHGMQGLYGIKPDLVVMGKAIGGGLPIGAVGGQARYFEMGDKGLVYHSGTHHGHPLATIAGIACLEVMDEKAYARMNGQAEKIRLELSKWASEEDLPFVIYGVGSHLGYEFTDRPGHEPRSCRDILQYSNEEHMQTFAFEMANRGIFPMYRGQIALSEPMTDADIDMFIDTSKEIITEMLA
jgi:glutamate-1-semialdehyde 2,1-aminomutase